MNIRTERLPDCRVRVHVEVPPTAVATTREAVTSEFSKVARVPGYRPGKAPRTVIEKRFTGPIQEETQERLVKQGCQEAEKSEKLDLLGVAGIEEQQFLADGSFSFTAEVVVYPEVPLPDYKGLAITVPKFVISEEDVDRAVARICERFAEYKELLEEPVEKGDLVKIDLTALIGGEKLAEKTEADLGPFTSGPTWVRLADDAAHPFDVSALEGAKIGDTVPVTAKLPDDFSDEALAGAEIELSIKVEGITRIVVPEPTEELATKLGVESLEVLRGNVRQNIETEAGRRRQSITENNILAALQERARDFDLPQHLVTRQTQAYVDSIVQENIRRGVAEDKIVEHQQEIFGNAAAQAKLGVKTSYLLNEIAEKENIHITDQDLSAFLLQQAQQSGQTLKKFVRDLKKSDGASRARNQLRTQRVLEFLISEAQVTEVEPQPPAEAPAAPAAAE